MGEGRNEVNDRGTRGVVEDLDAAHAEICAAQRRLLGLIAEADRRKVWLASGARDLPHWLAMRHGISQWKARRWIAAGHALELLPRTAGAFSEGELGIDKVAELTRFATAETETRLVEWAKNVSCAAVRRRADLEAAGPIEDAVEADRARSVTWWYFDDGLRFGLQAELPAVDGATVARALERIADLIPRMPGERGAHHADARRADALISLASASIARDADPDRATVVVHAELQTLVSGSRGAQIEDGPVIHNETARRLLCNARVQAVIEDGSAQPLGVGRMSREPSAWMMRQLRYRDHECRFPGCGTRRFTQAHHIVWWEQGGSTELANLVLVCSFHHKLVHEYRWGIERGPHGTVRWIRPDGTRYMAGAGPPFQAAISA